MEQLYLKAGPERLSPETLIPGAPGSATVGDFWTWAYSDVLSNRNRSIYAEFLVGSALGVTSVGVRTEWNGYDLDYEGKRIEVKSAAFAQSWKQHSPSTISFDVAPKRPWNSATNEYGSSPCRYADIYVFCLMTATDDAYRKVLNAASWEFYIVPTAVIEERFSILKRLSLSKIRSLQSGVSIEFLRVGIDRLCE